MTSVEHSDYAKCRTELLLADGAYHSKANFRAGGAINAVAVIADNHQKEGESCKVEVDVLLKRKRLCG